MGKTDFKKQLEKTLVLKKEVDLLLLEYQILNKYKWILQKFILDKAQVVL